MRNISGPALILVGVLHALLALCLPGVLGFDGIWGEIARAGTIDAVSVEAPRIWGWYWFLVSGPLLALFGLLCDWIERRLRRRLPLSCGVGLLAYSAACIVLDIDTGFWLVLLVAINMVVSSLRGRGP